MIFGYTMAVIVGFLLTATQNWTKLKTTNGYPLLSLGPSPAAKNKTLKPDLRKAGILL
jgi:hypothetical protein